MPAKRGFCEAREVYQIGRVPRPFARPKLTAFCTLLRSFSSVTVEAIARARSSSCGEASIRVETAASSADGSGPGAKRRRWAISGARWPSSKAQTESAVCTWTVPSREMRAGQALRAIAAPTTSGQRSTSSAMPACGPKRRSSARISLPSGSMLHLHELRGIDRQRRRMRRGDHRLTHARDTLGQNAAPAEVELREHVVEQQKRWARQELRLGQQQ